jgi:ABC-type bacteriocin/lantibiotic exporter with double-glycine peptidase domain
MLTDKESQAMRRIQQKRWIDCGVACVAMLAGTQYRVALKAIFQGERATKTSATQLRKALCDLNIPLASRAVRTRSMESLKMVRANALIKTKVQGDGWHWMVWDGTRKKHIDPFRKPYKHPRIHSYYVVEAP